MLCMPLRDSDNDIIGVVTLINKKIGCFTNNDEVFVEAFGVFAGHSLENVSKLEQIKQTEARCQVALDIMSYHASSALRDDEASHTCPAIPRSASTTYKDFNLTWALDLERWNNHFFPSHLSHERTFEYDRLHAH